MVAPTLVFAFCFAWRDSNELKVANLTALVFTVGAMMAFSRSGAMVTSSISRLLGGAISRWFIAVDEFTKLVSKDIDWKSRNATKTRQKSSAVVR